MPTVYKRLASAKIATAALDTVQLLYTNTNTNAILTTIAICNTSSSSAKYRLCISTAALTTNGTTFPTDSAGYIAYDAVVAANDTVFITSGLTLDTSNKYLLGSSDSTSVNISVFGAEVS